MSKRVILGIVLLALCGLIAVFPLLTIKDSEFGGADGQAQEAVEELNPDYEPWFEPILEPASGEVESLLFALQAAVGSGVVCFILGRITARKPGAEG